MWKNYILSLSFAQFYYHFLQNLRLYFREFLHFLIIILIVACILWTLNDITILFSLKFVVSLLAGDHGSRSLLSVVSIPRPFSHSHLYSSSPKSLRVRFWGLLLREIFISLHFWSLFNKLLIIIINYCCCLILIPGKILFSCSFYSFPLDFQLNSPFFVFNLHYD